MSRLMDMTQRQVRAMIVPRFPLRICDERDFMGNSPFRNYYETYGMGVYYSRPLKLG
jgi:hypothetical protein